MYRKKRITRKRKTRRSKKTNKRKTRTTKRTRKRSVKRKTKKRVNRYKKYGMNMQEKIVFIDRSHVSGKKYTAIVSDKDGYERSISFGAKGYEQYRDLTGLKLYKRNDHLDSNRRRSYYSRHSGVDNKSDAVKKEIRKSRGYYNAKILSHLYLW